MRRRTRGQALVEFALVLPLLLLLLLGGIGLSLALTSSAALDHGAREAAIAGAQSGGCGVAEARVPQILGYAPEAVDCSETGQMVTVRIRHSYAMLETIHGLFPFVPATIEATGRAVKRDPEPSPSSS